MFLEISNIRKAFGENESRAIFLHLLSRFSTKTNMSALCCSSNASDWLMEPLNLEEYGIFKDSTCDLVKDV